MSWSQHSQHTSQLCCVVQSIGTLYGRAICKQCLKEIVKAETVREDSFPEVLAILNAFTLNEKT